MIWSYASLTVAIAIGVVAQISLKAGVTRSPSLASIGSLIFDPYVLAGLAAYAASKGAIVPLTKTLALEWVEHGITANAIAPGYVDTPLVEYVKDLPQVYADTLRPIPMGRWGEAQELGDVIGFLCSPASRFVTGVLIPVDGGYSISG